MQSLLGVGYKTTKKIISGSYKEPVQEGKKFSKIWYTDRECINEFNMEKWDGNYITVYATMDNENEFRYRGTFECNGNNYIDTGMCLFSKENAHHNFKISFEVETNSDIANKCDTIMNSMFENSALKWPGVSYRISYYNEKNLEIAARQWCFEK